MVRLVGSAVEMAGSPPSEPQGERVVERLQVVKIDQAMGPRFYVHARTSTGRKVVLDVEDHLPFFYAEDGPATHREVLEVSGGFVGINGHKLNRYTVTNPRVVRDMRGLFKNPHEADIPYTQRVLIDHPFNGVIEAPVSTTSKMTRVRLAEIKFVQRRVVSGFIRSWADIETGEGALDDLEKGDSPSSPIYLIGLKHEGDWHCFLWHPLAAQMQQDGYLPPVFMVPSKMPGSNEVFPVQLHIFGDERGMMTGFVQWLRINSPDTLAGWNTTEFDVPYLIKRGERIGIRGWDWGFGATNPFDASLPGTHNVDLLAVHRKQSRGVLKSNTLKAVAEAELGIILEKVPGNIEKWWKEDLLALIRYNTWDIEATWRIDEKKKYTEWALNYAFFSGVDNVMDVVKASIVSDVMLNRRAHREHHRHIVLPMKPELEEPFDKGRRKKEERFTGAHVRKPVPGIHEGLAVVDFSGMYPTIVIGANISYETYCNVPDCTRPHITVPLDSEAEGPLSPTRHRFHLDEQGLVPGVMEDSFQLRGFYDEKFRNAVEKKEKDYWKDQRKPIKEFQNACGFGVQGYKGFRLYRREVAESITAFGQLLGKEVARFLVSRGFVVTYGDTDSVMFKVPGWEDIPALMEKMRVIMEDINQHVRAKAAEWGMTHPERLSVGWEKFFSRYLQGTEKKRYAGLLIIEDGKVLPEPRLVIVGFESRRSETPQVTVELQEKVFDMVLRQGSTPDQVYEHVQGVYRSIRDGRVDVRQVAFRPRQGRDLDDYKVRNQVVKAIEYSQEWLGLKFRTGDRVLVVPIRSVPPNRPKTDVLGLTEDAILPPGFVPDWRTMADLAVKGKVESVFGLIGLAPRIEALGMASLADYFAE